jgi:cytochrome c oxidase assembly protein subunit 11
MSPAGRRRLTAAALGGLVLGMLGLTAAAVPLYDLFCRVTGYGGTVQRVAAAPAEVAAEMAAVTVRVDLDAATAPGLPWRFAPLEPSVLLRPGEERLTIYTAENLADAAVVGRAVYNVAPHKAGPYFAKLACFCFEQQVLEPGQRVDMPVSFFVDPAMLADPATRELRQITLSYTFFVDVEATRALRLRRAAAAAG